DAPLCVQQLEPTIATASAQAPQAPPDSGRRVVRRRRITRQRERAPLAIAAAIPKGSMRVRRASRWVQAVDERAEAELVRTDRREAIHRIALALLERSDVTRTTRPSWDFLAERAGCSRRSVARHLATLQRWGLLGTVASGRSGACCPGGRYARRKPASGSVVVAAETDPAGEVAVYVLCEVSPVQVVADSEPVDTLGTPPLGRVNESPRRRTREGYVAQIEPLRGPHDSAAPRPAQLTARRQLAAWPAGVSPSSKDELLRAAARLRHRLPVLSRISTRHVRSICREFFRAGWTIIDLHRALDYRPDGRPWPHDGATGVGNVGAW